MRELIKPPETEGDDNATEMARIWLAHNDLHVSLLLGMWKDAEECDVNELEAWGELLADTVQHIANGLNQSHGWDTCDSVNAISKSFLKHIKAPESEIIGEYTE